MQYYGCYDVHTLEGEGSITMAPSRNNPLLAGRVKENPLTETTKRLGELLDGPQKAKSTKKRKVSRPPVKKVLQPPQPSSRHWAALGAKERESSSKKVDIFSTKTLDDAPSFRQSSRPIAQAALKTKKPKSIGTLVQAKTKENRKNARPRLNRQALYIRKTTPIPERGALKDVAKKPENQLAASVDKYVLASATANAMDVSSGTASPPINSIPQIISFTKDEPLKLQNQEISSDSTLPSKVAADENPSESTAKILQQETTTTSESNPDSSDEDGETSFVPPAKGLSLMLSKKPRRTTERRSSITSALLEDAGTGDIVPVLEKAAETTVAKNPEPSARAAWEAIPRPVSHVDPGKKKTQQPNNDNFVRLNLRNAAGACHGARDKKRKRKADILREERQKEWKSKRKEKMPNCRGAMEAVGSRNSGIDPVDDFLDGMFCSEVAAKKTASSSIPKCSGHQRPCKISTVRNNTNGNKGRQFYSCPYPRGEQCYFFQWTEDTLHATRTALMRNGSLSGFIARQVTAHVAQLKILTIPELVLLAKERGVSHKGKKPQLLARLAIWVRDEVAKGCGQQSTTAPKEDEKQSNINDVDEVSSSSDEGSTSSEELELVGKKRAIPGTTSTLVVSEENCSDRKFLSINNDREISLDLDEDSVHSEDITLDGNQKKGSSVSRRRNSVLSDDDSDDHSIADIEATGKDEPDKEPTCPLHSTLQTVFGHSSFREGQEWAVRRCLNQQRSLLVAPTGFGKSLCYAIPATMLEGVCIVVSPLLSLIQDQIRVLPPRVAAATLSGKITTSAMAATLDDIIRGRIKIVFVSPERLTSQSFRRMFRPKFNPESGKHEREFPEVSLLCVDEAHCLSQWAHNFRPSYLRLTSMLKMIQPKGVLAITATAGPRVVDDISRSLQIQSGSEDESKDGVRVMKTDRDNIDVKCLIMESQGERLDKLLKILSPKEKSPNSTQKDNSCIVDGSMSSGSVIVYVWRQRDAEVVAENIQAAGVTGGVVVYHGGMDPTARARSQSKFMRGKARICVATVAFGLGINKADIEGVIHMYLSSSPEHYLQEIGRAGRDGRPATAVALILGNEVLVRNSLSYSDLMAKSQIRGLISLMRSRTQRSLSILPSERRDDQPINLSLPLQAILVSCACKTETIETVVSLLEQSEAGSLVSVEGVSYDNVVIAPKRQRLSKLVEREDTVRAIQQCAVCLEPPAGEASCTISGTQEEHLRRDKRMVGSSFGSYSFSVTDCSNCLGIGAEPRHIFAALRRLESSGEIDMVLDNTSKGRTLNLKLTPGGMRFFRLEDEESLDFLVTDTLATFSSTVLAGTAKVLDLNYILHEVSSASQDKERLNNKMAKSPGLLRFQELIARYFEAEGRGESLAPSQSECSVFDHVPSKHALYRDAQSALNYLKQIEQSLEGPKMVVLGETGCSDYTALAVTKFLHGIASATVRLDTLRKNPLFGCMQGTQFEKLSQAIFKLLAPGESSLDF